MRRHFSKDTQTADKHGKRGSTSLTIREIQMKTKRKQYLTLTRMATIKNPENKCWQGRGLTGTLAHEKLVTCKIVQLLCKRVWWFLKSFKPEYHTI